MHLLVFSVVWLSIRFLSVIFLTLALSLQHLSLCRLLVQGKRLTKCEVTFDETSLGTSSGVAATSEGVQGKHNLLGCYGVDGYNSCVSAPTASIPLKVESPLVGTLIDLRRLILGNRLGQVLLPGDVVTSNVAAMVQTVACLTLWGLLPYTVGSSSKMGLLSTPSLMKRTSG